MCPEWKAQQEILWPEVWKETGRGRLESRFTIRDPPANGRGSQAVLDFLSITDVGRLVPTEEDAGSEISEWEREEERRAEAEERGVAGELGAGEELPLFLPMPSFMAPADDGGTFFCLTTWLVRSFIRSLSWSFLSVTISFVSFPRYVVYLRPGRRAKGSLQRAAITRTADGKNG